MALLDTLTPGLLMDISTVHLVSSLPVLLLILGLSHPECLRLPFHFSYTHLHLLSGTSFPRVQPYLLPLHWHVTETHSPFPSLDFPWFAVNSDLLFLVALSAQ